MTVIDDTTERVEEILESVMALDLDLDGEWLGSFNAARDELVKMIAGPSPMREGSVPETVPEIQAVSPGGVKSVDAWTKFSEDKEGFIAP
jgi:hypothetical protein